MNATPNIEPKTPIALKLMQYFFSNLGKMAPKWMGGIAYKLWFSPTRYQAPARELDHIKSAQVSTVMSNGVPVRVWCWGDGPVILFLHGWEGRGTQVSAFIDPLIQKGFKVIGFDAPAHGDTPGKMTNAIEFAKATQDIIAKYGPLHGVITHSFGAMVFCFAYQAEMPLEKAVFICPPATIQTPIDHFKSVLQLPDAVEHVFIDKLKQDFGNDIFDKLSVLNNVKKLRCDLLVIHDEDDNVVPLEDSRQIASLFDSAQIYQTKSLGHRRVLRDEAVVRRIQEFF